MSSAINSTTLDLENQPFLPARTFAAGFTQTTAQGNRVTQNQIPTSADVQGINLKNRIHDFLVVILTAFIIFCIIASFISLTGWFLYSVAIELSGWNLQDFVGAIQGHPLC